MHPLAQMIARAGSIQDLADRSGLPPDAIEELCAEGGLRWMPDPPTAAALAEALGVSIRELVQAAVASIWPPIRTDPLWGPGALAEIRRIVETSATLGPAEREFYAALADELGPQN